MKSYYILFLTGISFLTTALPCGSWGFFAHKEINRLAIFTLPPQLFPYYKIHLNYISDKAVNADKRRYAVKEEAPRHFIDLDAYPDSLKKSMPKYWNDAIARFHLDTITKHGVVPWHIYLMKVRLTEAFKVNNTNEILRLSADIGHYIGDAHVPLHTTRNYNGQFTNQHGIHGFWESRLPELFSESYNFFVGRASYQEDVQEAVWKAVYQAHDALDSVLTIEASLNSKWSEDRKYSIEERNGISIKVYSAEYSRRYHQLLAGQVERQMAAAVKLLGDVWYTSWIDAGQPDLQGTQSAMNFKDTTTSSAHLSTTDHEDCHR